MGKFYQPFYLKRRLRDSPVETTLGKCKYMLITHLEVLVHQSTAPTTYLLERQIHGQT